jgi:hypothetical protein
MSDESGTCLNQKEILAGLVRCIEQGDAFTFSAFAIGLLILGFAVVLWRRPAPNQPYWLEPRHVIEIRLRAWERLWVWYYASWRWRSAGSAMPAMAQAAMRKTIVHPQNERILKRLSWPRPPFDAVVIRQVIKAPAPWTSRQRLKFSSAARTGIRSKLAESDEVKDMMKRLMFLLAQAGYLPLVHSHSGAKPSYIFNAKGAEETRQPHLENYPHKLPLRPATIMPHCPYGHSFDGFVAGQRDGTVAPDIVAFIMMDASTSRRDLGPRLYYRTRLAAELGPDTTSNLAQQDFQITSTKPASDASYDAIDGIELFGVSGTGIEFMKFDYARIEPSSRTPHADRARGALMKLRQALDDRSDAHTVDLQPGDVLLVNNWRTATAWDDEGRSHSSSRRRRKREAVAGRVEHMHVGQRVVFQMNFYLPREQFAPMGLEYEAPDDEGGDHRPGAGGSRH